MDKPSVYIETSIVSYLAADPSRHPVTLRNQQLTHAWWNTQRERYRLFTSKLVIREAARGDPAMADSRRDYLSRIELLEFDPRVTALAAAIMKGTGLPERATTDVLHIAMTAVWRTAYLLTWDSTHIANPALQPRLKRICGTLGYDLAVLCTPTDLMRG